VCDTVGQAGATLVAAPFDWLAAALGAAAAWMFHGVWTLFDTTTMVNLTEPGYVRVYDILFGAAVFIMLIFFTLQLITGTIRRDPTALSRAVLGLAKSVLGSFLIITVTTLLLQVVDQLCTGIINATGNTLESMGAKIGLLVGGITTITIAAPGAGTIVTIFLAFLLLSAAAILWFTLLVRKALILVAIILAPIALAGAPWDATRGWFAKWASFVLALIVSKLVIVVVFLVAITQVNAPIDLDLSRVADPLAGIVLMFIAAFAPYMVYKFIAFAGFDVNHVMAAEQESKQAMNRPIPTLGKSGRGQPKKILNDDNHGGSSTGATPPAGSPMSSGGSEAAAPAGTGAGSGAAGAGGTSAAGAAEGAATAGGSTAAAGAAGPIGLAVVAGAKLVTGAAKAGPALGNSVGGRADGHASAAAAMPSDTHRD
jgi:hypothetical protein